MALLLPSVLCSLPVPHSACSILVSREGLLSEQDVKRIVGFSEAVDPELQGLQLTTGQRLQSRGIKHRVGGLDRGGGTLRPRCWWIVPLGGLETQGGARGPGAAAVCPQETGTGSSLVCQR